MTFPQISAFHAALIEPLYGFIDGVKISLMRSASADDVVDVFLFSHNASQVPLLSGIVEPVGFPRILLERYR